MQMANRHTKRCSTSVIIREMLIKTTMNIISHLSEWLLSIRQEITSFGCRKKGTLIIHCWWECKLLQPPWKTVWRSLKKLKIEPTYDSDIPLLGFYPKKTKTNSKRHTHPYVHHSIIYNSQDMETT